MAIEDPQSEGTGLVQPLGPDLRTSTTNHRILGLGIHIRNKGSTKSVLEPLVLALGNHGKA